MTSRRRTARSAWWALPAGLLLGAFACAVDVPLVEDVLQGDEPVAKEASAKSATAEENAGDNADLTTRLEELQAELDHTAAAARKQAQQQPDDAALAVDAARSLFRAADVRMQRAELELLAKADVENPADLIGLDDDIGDSVRGEVLSLVEEGTKLADHALELTPDDPGARLYHALDLSLTGWGVGTMQALLRGLGPKISTATKQALKPDPTFEGGAPLRLRGRFLTRAPWPYGDLDQALDLLRRAVRVAPVPVNHLFLGDALWLNDQHDAAVAEWRQAVDAKADGHAEATDDVQREFARHRLALVH